jgi:hypothetical protein
MQFFRAICFQWIVVLVLIGLSHTAIAQTPYPLEPGFQIDSVMTTLPNPNRLAYDAVTDHLYYCLPGGDIYRITMPPGQQAYDDLLFTFADHGITHPQGLHFRDSVLYVSGNTNANPGYVTARISKATLQPNGNRSWATVVETQPHPASLHPFTSVITDPQGQYLYWASGARTMLGEVWSDNGQHPGRREGPYNSRLYKIPIGTTGLVLPADSTGLDGSGYVYCKGLRNAYDMDFDAAGELFSIDNSGERDDPEELNWLRQGEHYGFPWKMSDHWNPLRNPTYDVNQDPLVNPLSGGYQQGLFTADPNFPAPPALTFIDPLKNTGPDAVYYRDSVTGEVRNAYDNSENIRSFTAHRSPLGFFIDRDSLLDGAYAGAAYVLSYMPGGDSTGMSPLSPWGTPGPFVDPCQDMLKLDIQFDSGDGDYVLSSRRMIAGFYLPVDAAQVGNSVYVLEQRGGGRSNLWKVSFPLESADADLQVLPYALTVSPQPASDHLTVQMEAARPDEVDLHIYDLNGKVVLEANHWQIAAGKNRLPLKLENLPGGMYLLRVQGLRGIGTVRVVKQ